MNVPLELSYTVEEWQTIPDCDRFELLDGRLAARTMGAQSSLAAANVVRLLGNHAEAQKLGKVLGADGAFQLFPDHPNRVRIPDASFVRQDRLPDGEVPEGHFRFPPDLAIEAVSPTDVAIEVDEKIEEYLRAGVPLVWVLFPRTRVVMVYRADGTVSRLRGDNELSGETVVAGFRCRVADLLS